MSTTIDVPDRLLASLEAVRGNRKIVLLVRHADRAEITPGKADDEVGILEIGIARAEALARILEPFGGILWSESSPLLRCIATACSVTSHVSACTLLGAPGAFVVDQEQGGRAFGNLGTERVVRAQMNGHRWPFMRSLEDGSRLVLNLARECLETREGSGLLVSHDAIVMPVVTWTIGHRFQGEWLPPLDGMVLTLSAGGGLTAWWAGHSVEVIV